MRPSPCPPTPLRLALIDPTVAAHVATERVMYMLEVSRRALGQPRNPLTPARTPVYRRALALARYAVAGVPLPRGASAQAEVAWLEKLLHLRRTAGEPKDALSAVLHGALAREALQTRRPLSAVQLALLSGYDRDHILAIAASLPGAHRAERLLRRPWRFRVNKDLHAFIAAREEASRAA